MTDTRALQALRDKVGGGRVLTHWSASPLAMPIKPKRQGDKAPPGKPCGFWLSDETDFGWREWCDGENYGSDRLQFRTDFEVDMGKILHLKTPEDVVDFGSHYQLPNKDIMSTYTLDWRTVSESYSGILISPYQHSLRFDLRWYYGWDCASACVWNPDCLTLSDALIYEANGTSDKA